MTELTAWERYAQTAPVSPPPLPLQPSAFPPPPVTPAPTPVVLPPTTSDKAWITGMGGVVATFATYITAVSAHWPEPWPYVVGFALWGITTFLTRQIPNKPIAVTPPPPK